MRAILTVLLAAAIVTAVSSTAEAGRRRRVFKGQAAGTFPEKHPPANSRELYPKYYGGFHARALQNIGIPTGDIGLRGNGITVNPW
jgi:hypothetical protein